MSISTGDWTFHIDAGLDLDFEGVPDVPDIDTPLEKKAATRVARVGLDDLAVKPDLAVEEGQSVQAGDVLWRDRRHPEVCFTAPASGHVAAINRGKKRKLVSVVIGVDANAPKRTFAPPTKDAGVEGVRAWLMDTGLWTALLARPFGIMPAPGDQPVAVLVTAMRGDSLAPEPGAVIARHGEAFREGLKVLVAAADHAPLFVCTHPQTHIVPMPGVARRADFSGSHAAALPGTHIDRLCPVGWHGADIGLDGQAWHIGYQDVIAMGVAALSGALWTDRVITLAGPRIKRPRHLVAPWGGSVADIVRGELSDGPVRLVAGGPVTGRAAFGAQDFLGPRHVQITALQENRPARVGGTAMGGAPGAVLPVPDVDRAWPFDIPVTPLMRALAVGDGDAVRALGGLALVEDDVAALTFACPSKTEYGVLLRRVLTETLKMEEAGT